jgi:NADPH2:quinone reductase
MDVTFPPTIQAIRIAETGGLEVIKKDQVPFPEALPGHLIIKVRRTRDQLFEVI